MPSNPRPSRLSTMPTTAPRQTAPFCLRLYAYYKGIAALLTGLIICDICNFLSCIVLPIGDESLEAAPKYSKDAPAAAAAAEGEVKGEQV